METNLFYQQLERGCNSELDRFIEDLKDQIYDLRSDYRNECDEETKKWLLHLAELTEYALSLAEEFKWQESNNND